MFIYDTVSEAVNGLNARGFSADFNILENSLVGPHGQFEAHEFEIVEIHRFEGDSDPADEAVVYAIESRSGMRGVLVNGYGLSADEMGSELVKKFNMPRS
jgi:NADPH:quinone reductase